MPPRERLPPFPSHITITTINDFPYSEISYENGKFVAKGICFEFFEALVQKYNFTYTIIPPDKDVIGNEKTGMIKQLYNKEVDMAVSFIPIISQLREFVEFSDTIEEMDTTFLIPRPGTSATGTGLFAPFSERVWWAILLSIFVIGPAIYALIHLRMKFAETEGGEKFTFFMCLWFAYAALLKQGTIVAPTGDSVRLAFAAWWIFITILASFYTANLTAFFTLNKFTLWINSLDDLLYWRYSWWAIDGRSVAALVDYKDAAADGLITLKKWGYGYYLHDYHMSYTNLLKYADKRTFVVDRTLALLAIEEDYRNRTLLGIHENYRCRYAVTDSNVLSKPRGFAFPKGSIIRKYLKYDMMSAFENGFMEHYRERRTAVSQVCPLDITMPERQLQPSDLYVTYKVCLHCYCLAGVLFVLEVIIGLCRKFINFRKLRNLTKVGEIKGTGAPPINPEDRKKSTWARTPPPTYEMSTDPNAAGQKTFSINGRDYALVNRETGEQRLIPTKGPSSYLFQYIH